ncbi:hypothetical protein ANN_03276, partial [Periplaneta americana]
QKVRTENTARVIEAVQQSPIRCRPESTKPEPKLHRPPLVNKQNFRYWSDEQSIQVWEKPLHSPKITVWCGVSALGIIGPCFFEEDGRTVTVNSERYQQCWKFLMKLLLMTNYGSSKMAPRRTLLMI